MSNPGEHFVADLKTANQIALDLGVQFRSLVFPRNQVLDEFLPLLTKFGIQVYRGNPRHWLYRDGHTTPGGIAGRAMRFADSWIPMTGAHISYAEVVNGLTNVPASLFLRPWARRLSAFEPLRLIRLKQAMTMAARSGGIFHLWWHPHNFGVNLEQNLIVLELLLQHYQTLEVLYGMRSSSMGDFAQMETV